MTKKTNLDTLRSLSHFFFRIRRSTADFLINNSTSVIIFFLLLIVGIVFINLAYMPQADTVSQSITLNVATDALFAIFMIFGITSIESHRRKRENKALNESIYTDLRISLNKTMLKLLIELGRGGKSSLIRTNFYYLVDCEIYRTFGELAKNPNELDEFIVSLRQRRRQDIDKILRVREVVDEGMRAIEMISRDLRPGMQDIRIPQYYSLREIEDPSCYEEYLVSGKRYGLRYIYKNGYFSGHAKTEVHTVDWFDTLGEFKSYLTQNMQYICETYHRCS